MQCHAAVSYALMLGSEKLLAGLLISLTAGMLRDGGIRKAEWLGFVAFLVIRLE